MYTIEDYRAQVRLLLGDVNGRRYSDEQIDVALQQALETASHFLTEPDTVRARVIGVDGLFATLNFCPEADVEIHAVRQAGSGRRLRCAVGREAGKLTLQMFDPRDHLLPGECLTVETAVKYRIPGLNEAADGNVPDGLRGLICEGAAGYALRIRARSVTEVFGKRPEDRAALERQGNEMIRQYQERLDQKAAATLFLRDPWP